MTDSVAAVSQGAAPPELAGLVEGLGRVLDVEAVRPWCGPVAAPALSALRDELGADEVAVLCFTDVEPTRPSLREAIDAVVAAGMEVAWSGLVRNSSADIRRQTPAVVVAADHLDDVRSLLATGSANLLFDQGAPAGASLNRPIRVCIASYEVVGPTRNGGIGTANTSLAEVLAAAGHEVTLLYTGYQSLDATVRSRWERHYEQRGVAFRDMSAEQPLGVDSPHFNQVRAYELYRWLEARDREAAWDVVHVPECQGHGYYALLARRLGLAFADCTFVVGTHSPTRWVYEANRWVLENAHRLIDDFLERRCVELADVIVGPSAYLLSWMEAHGWSLPERRFVQHYATSGAVARTPTDAGGREEASVQALPEGPGTQAARDLGYEGAGRARMESLEPATPREPAAAEVDEVVFFGRLETRKGLETFCDALDILAEDPQRPSFRVCFMGSETPIQGTPAGAYVRERSRDWPWPIRVELDRNQLEAVAYIRQPGRLVVMPSPVDNSPNTVLEALGLGIPFITSRGGGIPELIEPLDLDDATFEPTDEVRLRVDVADPAGFVPDLGAESLAATLRRATVEGLVPRPRFAVDPEANERVHVEWHERVVAARAERAAEPGRGELGSVSVCIEQGDDPRLLDRARGSFERQDLAPTEILVDAAETATGEWLFLCDAATTAKPELLSTLLRAADFGGADVVTAVARYAGDERAWHGDVPLGDSPIVGLYYNCFGAGGALVRRAAFERLGGFEVDGPPAVRRRDLLARATLAGIRFTVAPEPLLEYDREAAERSSLPPLETMLRVLRPYQRALPDAFQDLPGLALSASLAPPAPAADPAVEENLRQLEARVHTIVTSRSWRITEPLRAAMERFSRSR